jgi:hypothetical protein
MLRVKKRGKRGECVYCGKTGPITMDHVPPALLFPDPKPALITVPSCYLCNNSAAKDDEYFRLMLSLRADVGERPEVQAILPAVYRSAQKSRGLQVSINKWIQPKAYYSEAGVFLGMRPAVTTDPVRLGKVGARIVNGLFFHHTGKRLPDGYAAQACIKDNFEQAAFARSFPKIVRLTQPEQHEVGTVFKYWFGFPKSADPYFSLWFLLFYDQVLFLCETTEVAIAAARERKWELAKGVRPRA